MKVKPEQYIYPPRPAEAIPRDQTDFLGDMGWIAQLKFNDSRCLVKFLPGGKTELWNRHGEQFRGYTCPEWLHEELIILREQLDLDQNGYHLLDGGLLDAKHRAIKDTIVIWDILVRNGEHLLGTTYKERYESIAKNAKTPWYWVHTYAGSSCIGQSSVGFGHTWEDTDHILIPTNWAHPYWPMLWDTIAKVNQPFNGIAGPLIEGLVFKNPLGELSMGFTEKNNSDWIMRSRVKTGRHLF